MGKKDFFQSKATWGALMVLLAPVFNHLGFDVDTGGVVDTVTTIIGGLLFLFGQFTRKTEITSIAGVKIR